MARSPEDPTPDQGEGTPYEKTVSPHVSALSGGETAADHVELPRVSPMAISALILSCVSVFGFLYVPLGIFGLIGLIGGFKARKRIKREPLEIGDGYAMAAIFVGAAMVLITGLYAVMFTSFYILPMLR